MAGPASSEEGGVVLRDLVELSEDGQDSAHRNEAWYDLQEGYCGSKLLAVGRASIGIWYADIDHASNQSKSFVPVASRRARKLEVWAWGDQAVPDAREGEVRSQRRSQQEHCFCR